MQTRNILFLFILALLPWLSACDVTKKSQEHTPLSELEQPVEQSIFVLWDSLSAWYQVPYEQAYPAQLEQKLKTLWYHIRVVNGWESGDTSSWLKTRIAWITADAQSGDIALIVIGWNDGLQWLSTDELAKNIKEVVQILQTRWLITIIWWMQIPTNLGETYRSSFAALYPAVASETNSVLIPFILSWVAGIPELNLRDGIHPNTTGQAIVAKTVLDTVVPLLDIKN